MMKALIKIFPLLLIGYSLTAIAESHISEISENRCQKMRQAGVMSIDAPVQCSRLRIVTFDYIDFQGKQHKDGEMIVMDAVAPYIQNIFDDLYALQFPIRQAKPIYHYQGDDDRSMQANNSSAFNYRLVTGKRALSLHAYGLAIDINPIQNPFIEFSKQGHATFSPTAGIKHANRMKNRLGKVQQAGLAEDIVNVFANNGFLYWGGFWNTPIDYQHFQVSRSMANLMVAMPADNAEQFFSQYVNWYRSCKAMYPVAYSHHRVNDYVHYLKTELGIESLSESYQQSPQSIVSAINKPIKRSAVCVHK